MVLMLRLNFILYIRGFLLGELFEVDYNLTSEASRSFDFQFPFHLYHVVVPVLIHALDYCYLIVAIIFLERHSFDSISSLLIILWMNNLSACCIRWDIGAHDSGSWCYWRDCGALDLHAQ